MYCVVWLFIPPNIDDSTEAPLRVVLVDVYLVASAMFGEKISTDETEYSDVGQ